MEKTHRSPSLGYQSTKWILRTFFVFMSLPFKMAYGYSELGGQTLPSPKVNRYLPKKVKDAEVKEQTLKQKILPDDKAFLAIFVIAILASIVSTLYFYRQGETLAYKDAVSHMVIARRFWLSPTPGFGQLGAVWPLLPHVLMLPLVWNNTLFYTGLAGSIPSMLCFIGTSAFIYKITKLVGGGTKGAIGASFVFMFNPNILYMQSTPMSELVLFFFMTGAVYFFIRWIEDTDKIKFLALTAVMLSLATLTRYEAWILLALITVTLVIVCWQKKFDRATIEDHFIWFGFMAFLGVVFWISWNLVFLHNPLYFQFGEYAKPSLWVSGNELAVHNLTISIKTYWFGMVDNLGIATLFMCIGAVLFTLNMLKDKTNMGRLAVLLLLFPIPFFIMALFEGQRPMHVMQINGNLYNVRFGLIMIMPAAILIGYLVQNRILLLLGLAVGVSAFLALSFYNNSIATLNEPLSYKSSSVDYQQQEETASWLKLNYQGGYVLSESFGNEILQFDSRVPTQNILYEGSYKLWEPALAHPDQYVEWVIMRSSTSNPDKVWTDLHDKKALTDTFNLVYSNDEYEVFKHSAS